MDLKNATTEDLVNELVKRKGVTQYVLSPDEWLRVLFYSPRTEYVSLTSAVANGPARVLIVVD